MIMCHYYCYNITFLSVAISSILSCFHISDLGITIYQDGCCSRILLFGFLGPVWDVSVAFVIRRGGALWTISELLSKMIFSMRSGMFFFNCKNKLYCFGARAMSCVNGTNNYQPL